MKKSAKNIKKHHLIFLLVLLVISACDDDLTIDTTKNTYYDDISDITQLNNFIFTTNYDLSGNSGSQIDLLKFETNADDDYIISDNFSLDMNGQGYFAITNDGNDLFLQSRDSHLIVKCSPIGEKAYTSTDTITTNWQPSGLAFDSDNESLLSLYRNLQMMAQYRLRMLSKEVPFESSRDETFQLSFIDTTQHGVYAMEYYNSSFYLLGVDMTHSDILVIMDNDLSVSFIEPIPDSTVVGLSFKGNELYLSYRDKRIEYWNTY